MLTDPQSKIVERLHAAEQVGQRLGALIGGSGPTLHSTQFYTRIRVKSIASVTDKIYRKRIFEQKHSYSLNDLTDIVGARVVTLYDHEFLAALDLILSTINRGMQGDEPIFSGTTIWDSFNHAKIYYRSGYEEYSFYYSKLYYAIGDSMKKELGDDLGVKLFKDKIEHQAAKPDKYSSAHIIFTANSYSASRITAIPIEFQIRSAAEDIWAEINHKLQYKIRNPFVWSASLQEDYFELRDDSSQLKSSIDGLYTVIARFLNHSSSVNLKLEKFKNPSTSYYNSLVMSIIAAISNEFMEDIDKRLHRYSEIVDQIAKSSDTADFTRLCTEAIDQCDSINDEFAVYIKSSVSRSAYETEQARTIRKMVIEERIRLLSFEKTRLKILIILARPNDDIEADQEIFDLCQQLIRFKSDQGALVRPFAVVSYWTYLARKRIDLNAAFRHLSEAYNELKFDAVLPSWSVYRSLIPRTLCNIIIKELEQFASDKPHSLGDVSGVRIFDKDELLRAAFVYAIEAFKNQKNDDFRRGDLSLRSGTDDLIGDIERVLFVFCLHHQLNSISILMELNEHRASFNEVLTSCTVFINGTAITSERRRSLTTLHETARTLIQT